MGMQFTEKDIDNLLQAVDESLSKAEGLSKSETESKSTENTEDPKDLNKALPPQPEEEVAGDAPAMPVDAPTSDEGAEVTGEPTPSEAVAEEGAPAAEPMGEEPMGEEPMGEEPAGEPMGEEALAEEGEEPISDEELDQIYASMPPEERERHYMILRRHLQGDYEKAEKGQEMSINAEANGEKPCAKSEDATTEAAAEENPEVTELKKKLEENEKQVSLLTKTIELLARPKRKAVTQLAHIQKSEADEGAKPESLKKSAKDLDKKELTAKLTELSKSDKLDSQERQAINDFCLYGEGKDKVIELIENKEGSN